MKKPTKDPQRNHPAALMKRTREYVLVLGDEAVDIVTALMTLILIGRVYGKEGLGVFSFLLSVFVIAAYVFEFGVGKYVEREIILSGEDSAERQNLLSGAQRAAVFSAGCGASAVLGFGAVYGYNTEMGKGLGGAFLILAAAVALSIFNTIRISALHGLAEHEEASSTNLLKRLVGFGSILLFSIVGVTPHYLVLGILLSEIFAGRKARKQVAMPPLRKSLGQWTFIGPVLREGFRYYFTDEAFRIVFFLDFFVLGLFVTSAELGVYSEASVLARLFLIVPLGAAPLFRIRFYKMASEGSKQEMFRACRRTAARLFYFHSLLGLAILLAYPFVLKTFFPIQSAVPDSFHIFSVLLPGLLFFGAASILEPVYAVQGKSSQLGVIALRVFLLNAFLNFYLVPHAGIAGAAAATTISLFIYFLASGRGLDSESRLPKGKYLLAGAVVYLCYVLFSTVKMPGLLTLTGMVLTLSVLFYLTGFFEGGGGAD
jgi:O-antigen/teichoic acid export membrane protein